MASVNPAGTQTRAWSTLVIKSFDEKSRTFEGIASTPQTDLAGDIVEPKGAKFTLPIPFLYQHDAKRPIGQITAASVKSDGIYVKGYVEKVDAPPTLKERLDVAWAEMKARLVRGLSIGFNPIKAEPIDPKRPYDGTRFTEWSWLELSAVTIAANQEASITSIKSIDRQARAATGTRAAVTHPAGDSAFKAKGNAMKSIPERLAELQGDRAEKSARMEELFKGCDGEFDKLEADQRDEYDALTDDVEKLDTDIRRLRGMQVAAEKATPVSRESGMDPQRASRVRQGDFSMQSSLPKGISPFTCAVIAKARAIRNHMSISDAAEIAKREWPGAPEVAQYLKAAAGTGASGNWAEPLNVVNTVEGQFIDLLLPATIIGRLDFMPSDFNVKMIRQTAGPSTANWVGNASPKPVGELAYDTVQINQAKIADIVVLTDDQINTSRINSVANTQQSLIRQIAKFADAQLVDPSVSAGSNNPASLTNGVNDIPASGTSADNVRHDLFALLNRFSAANIGLSGVTLVMSTFAATGISFLTNALGQAEFPDITVTGGALRGLRVIVSDNVGGDSTGSNIVAIVPSEVLMAQNGSIRVDMSRDATIDMSGGSSPTFSLFQNNAVGLRAEWWVSWTKARDAAVQYISGAAYAPAVS